MSKSLSFFSSSSEIRCLSIILNCNQCQLRHKCRNIQNQENKMSKNHHQTQAPLSQSSPFKSEAAAKKGFLKPRDHAFWISRVHRENNGKLWSLQKGLNLGFVNQIPLIEAKEWLPKQEMYETQSGNLKIQKDKALENIQTSLLGSSPRTRNHLQPKSLTSGNVNIENTSQYYPKALIEPILPSQDKRHLLLQRQLALNNFGSDMNRTTAQAKQPILATPYVDQGKVLVKQKPRWESPTFARTTDNPPYGNYPSVGDNFPRTSLMVDGTYSSTSREFNPSNKNLYLSKKCFYKAETINGMFVLYALGKSQYRSFIPRDQASYRARKVVIAQYLRLLSFSLSKKRERSFNLYLIMQEKDQRKVQNHLFDKTANQAKEQFILNRSQAKKTKDQFITSQIVMAGEYERGPKFPENEPIANRSKSVMRNARVQAPFAQNLLRLAKPESDIPPRSQSVIQMHKTLDDTSKNNTISIVNQQNETSPQKTTIEAYQDHAITARMKEQRRASLVNLLYKNQQSTFKTRSSISPQEYKSVDQMKLSKKHFYLINIFPFCIEQKYFVEDNQSPRKLCHCLSNYSRRHHIDQGGHVQRDILLTKDKNPFAHGC